MSEKMKEMQLFKYKGFYFLSILMQITLDTY